MKKLKSLEFVQILSKNELQATFGGLGPSIGGGACAGGLVIKTQTVLIAVNVA